MKEITIENIPWSEFKSPRPLKDHEFIHIKLSGNELLFKMSSTKSKDTCCQGLFVANIQLFDRPNQLIALNTMEWSLIEWFDEITFQNNIKNN